MQHPGFSGDALQVCLEAIGEIASRGRGGPIDPSRFLDKGIGVTPQLLQGIPAHIVQPVE